MALKPRDVEKLQFKRSALGRRGYDESEVEEFRERVARELTRLNTTNKRLTQQVEYGGQRSLLADNDYLATRVADLERMLALHKAAPVSTVTVESLRAEVDSLRRENAQLREETQTDLLGVSVRAVNMLSQAQISAETTVAEAERYARELVAAAREQYADILRQAQESAAHAADGIGALTGVPKGTPDPVPAEIEYIRTYAQIAQKQMHTIVEALFTEIDRLGRPPEPAPSESDPEPAAGALSMWTPPQLAPPERPGP
ncbi:DivIVA domain-containing protein [Nocardia arizonensis]|uniref:DivIVA domain-containing protein n=1 Tax=Nocardia arizonensis TaxID=1141647 RepID=UPI0006CF4256|nr:DivIVA domain-containing protein [Nocardia arizonensis]